MFCVECGKECELIGPLCPDCYSKKNVVAGLPQYIDVTQCSHCSSFLLDGRWTEAESVKEAVESAVERELQVPGGLQVEGTTVQLSQKDERTYEATVTVALTAQGHRFERELAATIRMKQGVCKECSKQKGSYYEAIIQLRGNDRALPDNVEKDTDRYVRERIEAMRANSRGVFLTKVERVRGGIDFYVSTAQAARIIAREMLDRHSAEFKESSSLWGRQDGRDVYRVTFLVRLPRFGAGDVISCGSEDYYVRSVSKGMVRCIALPHGDERGMKMRDMESCIVVCRAGEIRRAVVLIEGEGELQVLDPETMEAIDVVRPKGFERKGDQIRLARTNTGSHALSDSW